MFVIAKREFINLFKGIKSIITVLFLLIVSYYSAKFSEVISIGIELTASEAEGIHTVGILTLILLLGYLFVASLSHNTVNREMEERTIRFLITRTSRQSIILGKFFGICLFWFVTLIISFLLISIFSQKVDLFIFLQTMSLLIYQIALIILLSVIILKPSLTMFLGIIFGLSFPAVGIWLAFTSNTWVSWIKFITPYYYLFNEDYTFVMNVILAVIMLAIANQIFKRREC
ncbi:ABC transporter permease subunit [Cytobacillus horneckiae]|uniref:ABC transporter permease subunit n=1 Tax=Cytobacillus horneckiae TaxID=549687 RepID=UPI0039A02209